MKKWFMILCLALSLISVSALSAAEFSSGLDAQLQSGKGDEFVSTIVILPNAIDIRNLDFALHTRKATLAERHREAIEALKYNAAQNQPAMLAELDAETQAGNV